MSSELMQQSFCTQPSGAGRKAAVNAAFDRKLQHADFEVSCEFRNHGDQEAESDDAAHRKCITARRGCCVVLVLAPACARRRFGAGCVLVVAQSHLALWCRACRTKFSGCCKMYGAAFCLYYCELMRSAVLVRERRRRAFRSCCTRTPRCALRASSL